MTKGDTAVDFLYDSAEQHNSIYCKQGDYQRIITTDQEYFDLGLLGELKDTFNQYREVMYKYGIRERALMKDYETVLDYLKKVEEQVTG